jgi:hypothetical protein
MKSLRIRPESDTSRYVNLKVVDSKGNEGIVGINHANHARPSQGEAWHKRPPAGGGGAGTLERSQIGLGPSPTRTGAGAWGEAHPQRGGEAHL